MCLAMRSAMSFGHVFQDAYIVTAYIVMAMSFEHVFRHVWALQPAQACSQAFVLGHVLALKAACSSSRLGRVSRHVCRHVFR